MPQDENPYDAALRVKQFIDTIFRDLSEGKEYIFAVTHGTIIRSFILEWFNSESNMQNCSVRLIERNENMSKVYHI